MTDFASLFTETPRHKVFLSYHHANDRYYKMQCTNVFSAALRSFISKSVEEGDISPAASTDYVRSRIRDEFIRDASVTIVLIGSETWKRKHVDWEISGSVRKTQLNSRCGLLGILLPTHPSYGKSHYDGGIVPPRLVMNEKCGYAAIYDWPTSSESLTNWIHEAYERRINVDPDNSYPHFIYNKSGDRWN